MLDWRDKFMELPTAAQRFIEFDELRGGVLLSDDILFFKIEFFPLGVEDVQIIGQAAIVSLGRKRGRLAGPRERAIEVP